MRLQLVRADLQMTSVRLDIPIPHEEARARGLPALLGRLVLEGEVTDLAIATVDVLTPGQPIAVHPLAPADAWKAGARLIEDVSTDVDHQAKICWVTEYGQLGALFSRWEVETLVLFSGSHEAAIRIVTSLQALRPKWWRRSEEGDEASFVKQLDLADPFVFFSPTLRAIEMIGRPETVLRCFDIERRHFVE